MRKDFDQIPEPALRIRPGWLAQRFLRQVKSEREFGPAQAERIEKVIDGDPAIGPYQLLRGRERRERVSHAEKHRLLSRQAQPSAEIS
ncbi:hypothetical protein [Limimaricola sp. AA108-03]|uniref:hypothetical protein n=1 Tax=Limimaricola sp. AA108-03 TaxID=3425945 RepID=UPI003D775055